MKAAEIVKELEFGKGPIACMYGGRGSDVHRCAKVCAWDACVCMHMCHVFFILMSPSIMYGVLCVCQCILLSCVSICGHSSAYL